ncbi:MAG TPA: methylcobamide--CoM methyltransferase, partial [Candidatus Methanomethylophilaceae archaeon]|nr:methylcobamide--CoM methyltransferase [Candidatus Methanomethylophilaceae archaeon]
MKKMTPKERFHLAMKNKPVDRPPVCGMTTTATTQLMDAVDAAWPEAHIDATKMARLAIGAYDFFGLESMRVPYCLTYEAEALGAEVNLGKKNSTPMVKGSPYRNN